MIKIILVDDHELLRNGIRSLLEQEHDLSVIGEANNGRDAVKLTNELKPDIVIMDMVMYDLNGIEASKQIKKDNPNIDVIALSMHSEKHVVFEALKAGVSGYIIKDTSHTQLIEAVRRVHLGHRYVSSEISDILINSLSSGNNSDNNYCPLSNRENEILQLITEGHTVREIARTLFISPKTVSSHRSNIMEKLDIHNLPLLTKYAIGAGLTSAEI